KRRPELHIYLLSWDFNMVYAAERELLPALRLRLQAPRRFHFKLDGKHPSGASQHQKLVVIDDQLAFVGGIDLSRWRWDSSEHRPDDERRQDPNGKPYPPFHDMMWCLQGPVARKLGDLARDRWKRAHGRRISPVGKRVKAPWPDSVPAMHRDAAIAIARTYPAYRHHPEVREVERLYLDAIQSARRHIYIENQYFTASKLADALSARLAEDDGPEVILVLPRQTGGWLEQMTMDVLRGRVVKRMQDADEHGRLRVYYPHQPGLADDECISVHAKFLNVDDRFMRIGSSNTSNRSMGLDSECDAALEARDGSEDGSEEDSRFIRDIRQRLLAEHLGCEVSEVSDAEQRHESLIQAIESLRSEDRSLRDLDCAVPKETDEMVPDGALIDPTEPFSPEYFVSQYVPNEGQSSGRKRLLAFAIAIFLLLALAAAWRWTPMGEWLSPQALGDMLNGLASPYVQVVASVMIIAAASFVMVPITLLAIAVGIVFGGWQAFALMVTGAMISSILGFAVGSALGAGAIERMTGSGVHKLSKRLADRGTVAVALLRLVPVAPFAIFNLVAGASHIGFRQFTVGSLMGFAPGLGAVTLFSSTLWQAVSSPSWQSLAIAAGLGFLLAGMAWLVKQWLRSG
ncbi:MAG: VTT domain-containing protein, partial [Gammaproteobacteria bacterium]